jgi:hypothetical protein
MVFDPTKMIFYAGSVGNVKNMEDWGERNDIDRYTIV